MFQALAKLVSTYPRWVLAVWFVLTLLALPYAARVGEVLTAQPGAAPGSVAAQVHRTLVSEFNQQENFSVVLVSRSATLRAGEPAFEAAYLETIAAIHDLTAVTSIQDYHNVDVLPLVSEDGHTVVALIGLNSQSLGDAKLAVDKIGALLEQSDTLEFHLAGGPATVRELEQISQRDAHRAELFGLPLSLVVLAIAFGSLIASGLPLIVALTSTTLSFATLFFLGQFLEFAVFTQSIVTMLGLATGIDYALLMVNRYREELRRLSDPRKAAAVTATTAGRAVAFSGITVMIALSALLVPPLNFIRSIGIGTMVVLLVSVLVSLTALPATLALLGKGVNGLRLTRREPGQRSRSFWQTRAKLVMRYPRRWAFGGVLLLLLLSIPALRMQVAEPGAEGMSSNTDAHQVQVALKQMGLEGLLNSYDVLIDFGERRGGFFNPSSVRDVSQFSRMVARLDRVERVHSATAVEGVPRLLLYQYYASRDIAAQSDLIGLVNATISQNDRYALVRVFPSGGLTPQEGVAIEQQIQTIIEELHLDASIGGSYIGAAEWTRVLYRNFPLALALVYVATFVLLGLAFRSLLIPIKSIILNTLSVGASFGIITLIFQYGVGAPLFGLAEGLGYIDTSAPIFIFAIVFGLSMDYEVFLVARIHEAHERGLSDREAVAEAISATGGVITSAALIMVVVFSLFVFSQVVLIKTLGLGLSIAVLLDATLVRLALVPAVMALAGRWNWWLPRRMARVAERVNLSHD